MRRLPFSALATKTRDRRSGAKKLLQPLALRQRIAAMVQMQMGQP